MVVLSVEEGQSDSTLAPHSPPTEWVRTTPAPLI